MSQFKGTIRSMMGPRWSERVEARAAGVLAAVPFVGLVLIVWHNVAARG